MRVPQPLGSLDDVFRKYARSLHAPMKGDQPAKVPVLDCLQQSDLSRQRSGVRRKSGTCRDKSAVGDPLLDALVVYANDQHSVIGQLLSFDGLAKCQGMKPFSETFLVVHINDFDTEFFSRLFQA